MSRKSTKTTEVTMTALDEVINTPVNFQFDETAQKLGIGEAELRERLESKLNSADVHTWDTIPVEHQAVIDAITRDLDAERSTRKLEPETPTTQLTQASEPVIEPPILQEEPQPEKKKRSRRQSTALTEEKSEAIKNNRQNASQTQTGIAESLTIISAQEGAQDGANIATAYLHGLVTNMTNIKGEGATVIAAEMLQRTSNKQGFNPDEVLQKIGVPLSPETREKLNDVMVQMVGKNQLATEEITDTGWGNGYNAQDELTRLKSLMNLSS
jgi:hypothetical protein